MKYVDKLLDLCYMETKCIVPMHINWYAGKYIGYGLCSIADSIANFTEAYRDRNDKECNEISKVRSDT